MRSLLLSAASAIVFLTSAAHSETIALSKLDRKTAVYIQRSNTGQNVECYEYILKAILPKDPGFKKSNYYVQFDDPDVNGIAVGAFEAGDYYSCEDGVLRSWDAGDSMVLKRF